MEKDITAFVRECFSRGGFFITGFSTGLTIHARKQVTVMYRDETFDIDGTYLDTFEELYEKVKKGYVALLKQRVIDFDYKSKFWLERLNSYKLDVLNKVQPVEIT